MRTGEKEQLRERHRKSPEMGCWKAMGGTPSKGILGMPGALRISLGGWGGGGRGPRPEVWRKGLCAGRREDGLSGREPWGARRSAGGAGDGAARRKGGRREESSSSGRRDGGGEAVGGGQGARGREAAGRDGRFGHLGLRPHFLRSSAAGRRAPQLPGFLARLPVLLGRRRRGPGWCGSQRPLLRAGPWLLRPGRWRQRRRQRPDPCGHHRPRRQALAGRAPQQPAAAIASRARSSRPQRSAAAATRLQRSAPAPAPGAASATCPSPFPHTPHPTARFARARARTPALTQSRAGRVVPAPPPVSGR